MFAKTAVDRFARNFFAVLSLIPFYLSSAFYTYTFFPNPSAGGA
jgi:hypothetical protein